MLDVDQTGCSLEDFIGYTLRKRKLSAAGENVVERITIHEEAGIVSYNKRDAGGNPEIWSVCSPSATPRSAWSSMSAAPPAALASAGRHRVAGRGGLPGLWEVGQEG